jgi:hypothetical protein
VEEGRYLTTLYSHNASTINPRNSPEGQECLKPMVAKCCKHNMGEYHKYCRDGKHQPSPTCPSPSTVIDKCMYAKMVCIYANMRDSNCSSCFDRRKRLR